jgi:hypothetical protein
MFAPSTVYDFHIKNTYITFESRAAYAVLIMARLKVRAFSCTSFPADMNFVLPNSSII